MSFGTYERRVRDRSLAYGRRINALAGCVERYAPLGFEDTFGYLVHLAGPFRHDEAALLRALDALTASRNRWLVSLRDYETRRKAAKRRGQRSPSAQDNRRLTFVWHGDARNAALYALGLLPARDHPGRYRRADAEVLRLASACAERRGVLSEVERDRVGELVRGFERLRRAAGWPDVDWPEWHRAHDSLRVLHLITTAATPD